MISKYSSTLGRPPYNADLIFCPAHKQAHQYFATSGGPTHKLPSRNCSIGVALRPRARQIRPKPRSRQQFRPRETGSRLRSRAAGIQPRRRLGSEGPRKGRGPARGFCGQSRTEIQTPVRIDHPMILEKQGHGTVGRSLRRRRPKGVLFSQGIVLAKDLDWTRSVGSKK